MRVVLGNLFMQNTGGLVGSVCAGMPYRADAGDRANVSNLVINDIAETGNSTCA